jgi:hypothetical protein
VTGIFKSRPHRGSVRFVVRRLENEIDIFGGADFGDLLRHPPDKLLRLDHARAEDEYRSFATNCDFSNA